MFIHIVLWNFKSQQDRDKKFKEAKEKLYALKNDISELKEIELGLSNTITQDFQREVCLITKFDSEKDYIVYRDHEKHLKVKEFLGTVFENRIVSDVTI